VVAGQADHISPWQSAHRSAKLLGGSVRSVLSTSGHIACLVNPPTNRKARFNVNPDMSLTGPAWLQSSQSCTDSWWINYAGWLAERNDGMMQAPIRLGSPEYPVVMRAPGMYVTAQ
jgi:poly(3-hydroxyalkanoate) synthetase